jgi:hypothetical protein
MANYDEMSFGKAFAAARKEMGAGKTFTYKGKSYSTNRADDKPAAAKPSLAPSTSKNPKARPSWMGTPGGKIRMGMSTPEGTRSDASRVSVNPPPKPAAPAPSLAPSTSQRPMPRPTAAPAAPKPAPKPVSMPSRPVSKTPGAKPAGEGKKLTYESRAMIARTTKPKK